MCEAHKLLLENALQAVIKLFNLDPFHAAGLGLPVFALCLPFFKMKHNILS